MAQVTFRSGEYRTTRYTPSSGNITAGDVVLLGNTADLTCGVAHHDITNGVLGTLAIGGGVYEGINLNNAANYAQVWWDTATDKFTTVSTNMSMFGFIVEQGGGGANSTCLVLHWPFAP
jgi:hypothetical protein